MKEFRILAAMLVLGVSAMTPSTASAARSYDNCTGFIEALPATISTQGIWCLKRDLSTAITTGAAVTIAANNVTIDCNDFKIGGLAAGNGSKTIGILATDRLNVSVRHCGVRGFYRGIQFGGGAGHLVEDNRLDLNLRMGISIYGADNNLVQRNRVHDTGGAAGSIVSWGISASADLIDNTVAGVFATGASSTHANGIALTGSGNEARNNQVRGLVATGDGEANGISGYDTGLRFAGNHISASAMSAGSGITTYGNSFCIGNTVANFATPYSACWNNYGNLPAP